MLNESDYCCRSTSDLELQFEDAEDLDDIEGVSVTKTTRVVTQDFPASPRLYAEKNNTLPYAVLTLDDVKALSEGEIEEISEILEVDRFIAECFLFCYDWQAAPLVQDWLDDVERVFTKANIDQAVMQNPLPTMTLTDAETFVCPVTTDEVKMTETDALSCGHRFSNNCWERYLTQAVKEDGRNAYLTKRCPMYNCKTPIPLPFWERHLPVELLKKLYERRTLAFVDSNPSLRWCPALGCQSVLRQVPAALERKEKPLRDVTCNCSYQFCFLCGSSAHFPVPCHMVTRWRAKYTDEAENVTWILKNTKDCPKCKRAIQKFQGCMHMTCPCGHHFCWLCLKNWELHELVAYDSCNLFDPEAVPELLSHRSRAKQMRDKYIYFLERFHAHDYGEEVATKTQLPKVRLYVRCSDPTLYSGPGNFFLEAAVLQIIECRRLLKWTYVFSFYTEWATPEARCFFEHQQGELERHLDRLQETTESFDLLRYTRDTSENKLKYKAKLLNLTQVIHLFFEKMSEMLFMELSTSGAT